MANSKITVESLNLHYGENHALKNVNMEIADHAITAFIGPSGCGKSTFLRCLNRMNDLVDGCRVEGKVILDGEDIYDKRVDTTLLRSDLDAISYGAKRFVTGLAKKVLLANNLGLLWTQISSLKNDQMSVLMAWIGIVAYAFQIYFDFSGYSDMAIGLGAILGFHFPENFNYPYIATSVTDFWHRWHISLSTWFKEYVYIPLGGNRKGLARQILNILIVWTLTGIWHGAGWNFLFWGLWFALFLILEKLFLGELLKNAPVVFGRVYTLAAVLISWVFFALEKPGEILAYLQAMFGLNGVGLMNTQAMFLGNEYLVLLIIALVACLPVGSLLIHRLKSSKTGPAMALYRVGEKVIPAALLILSVAYIVDASYNPFLYFRF